MILRKPYAFFIRYFKFFHIVLSVLVGYLIYNTNRLINFFSNYLYDVTSVVGNKIVNLYFNVYIYICLVLIIIVSLIIFSVMYRKNKPYKFYIINIFVYIAIIVVFSYVRVILTSMETLILNIMVVKLIRDILVLTIIFESGTLLVFITRGLGLNFKKFDFSSDIDKFEIESKDREEFEVNIDLDINNLKKDLRKNFRFFKYNFLESKFKIFIGLTLFIIVLIFVLIYFYLSGGKIYSEGESINFNGINYVVNHSKIINKYDKNLLVVDIDINSYYKEKYMYLNDLYINIEGYKIKNTLKYCSDLTQYGMCYKNSLLSTDYENYIIVYEIPEIYINSKFIFEYDVETNNKKVKLDIINEDNNKTEKLYNLQDSLEFNDRILKGISFKINFIDISNYYKLSYKYAVDDYTIDSYEYLRPSIDTDFDKTILKLNMDFNSNNKSYNTFYKIFSKYGSIRYYIDDKEYIQKANFEEILSSRVLLDDTYIGIDRNILSAQKIDLIFNVKDNLYIYNIKGDD